MGTQEAGSILVVDDEPEMAIALGETLRQDGFRVSLAQNGKEALEKLSREEYGWVISDVRMPSVDGMELLSHLRSTAPLTRVILMTGYGTVPQAVAAMQQGAVNFLTKPFKAEDLRKILKPVRPGTSPSLLVGRTGPWESVSRPILTRDPGMIRILGMIDAVAATPATVLIEGESGTGKELIARYLHERSTRAHRPFVAVNCAALPDNLLESELFGYEKGAFSGAAVRKIGKFELAHTGTILLDEIGEMEMALQAKLLRVIQEREIDRVGGTRPVPVDIRIVATTNRNLKEEVRAGRFREDLYYRLRVFPVMLPPLRERAEDIPLLAERFRLAFEQSHMAVGPFTQESLGLLLRHPWPGNVRELENVVTRAAFLAAGRSIRPEHLEDLLDPAEISEEAPIAPVSSPEEGIRPGRSVWEVERELILRTLASCGGNKAHSARLLGINVRTLRNKLSEYGIVFGENGEP
uniref:Putative two component, sigma54 specific, transcriptional regulator, Fis family n=1 Tax=Leptospirillum ferrodiazotrophum TaxID=412449 RepID=C6HWN9_9BACT|nr:MAG: putative two component, sigma54 specific, transcriptional regulator, Fis family [Leptospirillum ferrodiazotrophum]